LIKNQLLTLVRHLGTANSPELAAIYATTSLFFLPVYQKLLGESFDNTKRIFLPNSPKGWNKRKNNICQNIYSTIDVFQISLCCTYETPKIHSTACVKKLGYLKGSSETQEIQGVQLIDLFRGICKNPQSWILHSCFVMI
jgi:hypothetical protein